MGQITVFSGPERRRRWSGEDRLQILGEAFSPGACVAEVARRHDVSTGLVYTWRRRLREATTGSAPAELAQPRFAEAKVVEDAEAARPGQSPAIVVHLPRGGRISIFGSASPALAAIALKTLR